MRPRWQDRVAAQRQQRDEKQRRRHRLEVRRRDGVRLEVDGRWLTGFCSNDYLGLAQHFSVIAAFQDEAGRSGAGGTAAHTVCGHTDIHAALERELADWLQLPKALLFSTGYMANLATLQSLLGEDDVCVQDRLNHASLIDAARLAGCRLRRYPHVDAAAALRQLQRQPEGMAMLATDGVFSMDGDVAPLRDLALAAQVQQALLYVDDAHGIGVLGPDGRGSVAAARLGVREVPLQLATFGKALGGFGAALAGDQALIEHLQETARPQLYTTAITPAQAAATRAALRIVRRDQWRREKLLALVLRFRALALRHGFRLADSHTPIQPLFCDGDAQALALADALRAEGILVAAIRPPTVPEHGTRLRITFSALHASSDVDALVEALCRARDAGRDAGQRP